MSLCFLGNSLGINIVFSKVEIRLSSSGDEDGSKVRREPFELALEVEVKDLDLKAFLDVLAEQRDSRRRRGPPRDIVRFYRLQIAYA